MSVKKIILLSFFSLFLFGVIILLGGYGGHNIKFLAASILYFGFTYMFIIKAKNKGEKILAIIIIALPPVFVDIPIHAFNFKETLLSFPSSLALFIGIGFSIFLFSVRSKKVKTVLFSIYFLCSLWVAFIGYGKWIHYLNYDTFSDIVNYKVFYPIRGYDQFNNIVNNTDFKDKIVLLDFWHTRCGACFQEFPQLQVLYDKYKNSDVLKIFAVDKPLRVDTADQAFNMLKKRGYTFPILIPYDSHLPEKFGVLFYPTIIILSKSGNIVFKGDIGNCNSVIEKLLFSTN